MEFRVIDGHPVPVKAAGAVAEGKRRSGEGLNSCFRGDEARALLKRLGDATQSDLYYGYIHGWAGYNPANPPHFSTHECFADGVFLSWKFSRGQRIPDEMVGQDWTYGYGLVKTYNAMGIPAILTYPNMANEAQHVNLVTTDMRQYKGKAPFRNMRHGDRGSDVSHMTHLLATAVSPTSKRRYLRHHLNFFTNGTTAAVKLFQKDHGLTVDGVVGANTYHQIEAAAAYWIKRRAAEAKKPANQPSAQKPPPKIVVAVKGHPDPMKDGRYLHHGDRIIDISDSQGSVNFKVAAAHVHGVIARATMGAYGAESFDQMLTKQRAQEMRAAFGPRHTWYHYGIPQIRPGMNLRDSAGVEADHFFTAVKAVGGWTAPMLPPCLDLEENRHGLSWEQWIYWAWFFLGRLQSRLQGYGFRHDTRPMCYVGTGIWQDSGKDFRRLKCRQWRAQYNDRLVPVKLGNVNADIWQDTDSRIIPGVNGGCDSSIVTASIIPLIAH